MAARGLTAREVVDARKDPLAKRETVSILRGTNKVVAMKGKKVVTYDLKREPPVEKELLGNIMGPTGNLRAPALRLGKTLVVGFNEEAWSELLA